MKNPRRLKNFFLQPILQMKLGVYNVVLAIIFAFLVYLLFEVNFAALFATIIDLTENKESINEVIQQHMQVTMIWFLALSAGFVVANIIVAVWYTHRFVGPSVAFRRHLDAVMKEDYGFKTTLRQDDAFQDVADKLNELSVLLQKKYKQDERQR